MINPPTEATVECDNCGVTEEVELTEYAGDPVSWGIDSQDIVAIGWKEENGEHFCPNCKEDE